MPESSPHHILSVLVENKFGVLSRVAGLFSRRGYNIFSLAVSPTEDERFSRMTVVVDAESAPLEQVTKQLNKLIPVIKITELAASDAVERELMLTTVRAGAESRSQVTELAAIFEAKIVDVGYEAMTLMISGTPDKLDAITDLLAPVRHRRTATNRPHRAVEARPPAHQAAGGQGPRGLGSFGPTTRSDEHVRHDLLRRGRRSRAARGPQGRSARLRLPGPRPCPQPPRVRRRRARRSA